MAKKKNDKKKLLFVCTGNTCRSPLAKVLADSIFAEAELSRWLTDSAGLGAMYGMSASSQALVVANALGLDLSAHQSKPLTEKQAAEADLILVMTQAHKDTLLSMMPHLMGKVHTVREFGDSSGDITDPFGQSAAVYMATAQEIASQLRQIVKKLVENP